jgi:hypothetical protein|nr:MAG TPA_asm: hypothetical protein [Caudoviricetes sp.]
MEMKEKVQRAERLLNESGSDQNRRLIEIQEALKDDRRVMRLQAKIKAAATGSVTQKEAQYKLNNIYIENMTEEERDSDEGLDLEIDTAELRREILESRKRVREAERVEVKAWDGEETPKVNPVGLAVAAILGLTIGIGMSIIMGG